MKTVGKVWRKGIVGKLLVGCGGMFVALCSCVTVVALLPSPSRPAQAPAVQPLLSAQTPDAAVATAVASPTVLPTATVAPTDTPEPSATPKPSVTPEPTATARRVVRPTRTPAPTQEPLPTEVPTEPPAEVPTEAPQAAPPQPAPAGEPVITTNGSQQSVSPAWWPCQEGQIKANNNSGIYHVPTGRSYDKTFKNVTCYNTAQEAEANNFRAAKN